MLLSHELDVLSQLPLILLNNYLKDKRRTKQKRSRRRTSDVVIRSVFMTSITSFSYFSATLYKTSVRKQVLQIYPEVNLEVTAHSAATHNINALHTIFWIANFIFITEFVTTTIQTAINLHASF